MSRTFKTVDYDAALDLTVRLGDCLPPDHLARFVVDSVALLDLSALYARYGSRGGEPYAPEILLALILYGYATGIFSSRKIERATYEAIPFRYIAGNRHPDHDTIAAFRATFLPDLKGLFVQVLLLAQEAGVLTLGTISLDGTKIHADASKSKAVSYKRLRELEAQLRAEVEELFALAEQVDARERPDGLVVRDEIARREERLAQLAAAKVVLEERAREREALEQAAYEEKVTQRAAQEQATGHRPRGRAPTPPVPGPRAKDQYNFTDPDSRMMKNPTDQGFDQDYNAQIAVDQHSLLIVGTSLSNHPNDTHEAEPTLAAISPEVGTPAAAALDHGYWSPATLAACADRAIEPYIATGREPHHQSWQERFAPEPDPPPEDASAQVKMAYKLKTAVGKAIYGARKYTVEPVLGIITEVLGFRQFSLRGTAAAAGEWLLVCLAFNLKRVHTLSPVY
ncbi:MAG: transposase [Chloroflexi bacterium]|nr:transposase [Chloroflexota bacterium]